MKKNILFYLSITFCLFLLSNPSCKKNTNPSGETGGLVYTIADQTGDWGFPSPYGHYSRGPGYIRMSFLFDTLVWKNREKIIPALAEKWTYIPRENAWLFLIRKGVTWHDGKPFTPADVIFTYNYIKKYPYAWIDSSIIKKIIPVGDRQVKIYLVKKFAPFITNLAGTMPVLPEHIYNKIDSPLTYHGKECVIGTGPYVLKEYNQAQGSYRYIANKNYYKGNPYVKEIRFIKINQQMAVAAVEKKQVNCTGVLADLKDSIDTKKFCLLKGNHDWVGKLLINHKESPLSSPLFRKAIWCAIDREGLVKTCLRGHGLPGKAGLVPPDNRHFNKYLQNPGYDPKITEKILVDLGYNKKEGRLYKENKKLKLTLLFKGGSTSGSIRDERIAVFIKKQLEHSGIEIQLQSLEAKTVDNRVLQWKFQLALSGHGGMGGDPDILARSVIGKGFNSCRYYSNVSLKKLLQQQVSEINSVKRLKMILQVQRMLQKELPSLPLFYPDGYYVHDRKIDLYYTDGGIGIGIPIPLNKECFLVKNEKI